MGRLPIGLEGLTLGDSDEPRESTAWLEKEVRLSVSVMAHPSRKEMVAELMDALDVDSAFGGVQIVWDNKNEEWDTGKRNWEAFDRDATHHLVIQDDVLPCVDMIAGARDAIRRLPEREVASLYLGCAKLGDGRATPRHQHVTRAIKRAEDIGATWITTSGPWWGPAVIISTADIPDMLEFCQDRMEVYDRRMTMWTTYTKRRCWHPYPSFAEHKDEPSLVLKGRPRAPRVARKFIGADVSALTFDAGGKVVAVK